MSVAKNLLKGLVLWFVWVPLRYIIQYLPLKLIYRLSAGCAFVYHQFAGHKRALMARELKQVLKDKDDKEISRLIGQGFDIYVKRQAENLIYGEFDREKLGKLVSVDGIEHLDEALARGRGVIILLSHFGSFLMVLPVLGFMGYRINQLAGPPLFEQLGWMHKQVFMIRKRASAKLPVTFLQSDQSLFTVIRVLKKNECVAIAFDGRAGEKWVPVKMFGLEAYVSPGPVRIAMKTGAAIVPTFIVRQKDDTHKLIIEKPFELEYVRDDELTISKNTQKLADIFARYIQQFPAHYGMTLVAMRERAQKGIISVPLFKI